MIIAFLTMMYSIVFLEGKGKRGIKYPTIMKLAFLDMVLEISGIIYFLVDAFR